MSKEDYSRYGLEGFRDFVRNKIKFEREVLKSDDYQAEASFYVAMKVLCQEYYNDLNLNDEQIIKDINILSENTRELIKKRHDALQLKMKELETQGTSLHEPHKALPTK